ncbi:MAG: hypothetical protein A2622_00455 [Bdellovibrionales bacterium RIFCSPHIGHO2_01_FULL_40_29]|nr:MAG: hypothetical protein A2622_00455 [Bdellovibrionales bacterium RIFCSPHIGHO2_01_FULL_40_29]OFZ32776.1 MAG: hypothetical protein A3D17_05055 [Bdellovibrionales bacterium RIFCSPHIGHO2_02_FULL_40_15]
MMGTAFPSWSYLPSDQGQSLFKQAAPYIQASDIRFGNFEGTFFEGTEQQDGKATGANRYLFKTPTYYTDRLVDAGFNVMSVANNHSRDFGLSGLATTKAALIMAGIQYASKEGDVAYFTVRNLKIALLAVDYKSGPRNINYPQSIYKEIQKLKTKNHIVIVSVHAGAEGNQATHTPMLQEIFLGEKRGNSVEFARTAVDFGADALLIHGPHVPRGMEIYRDRIILYSLGNFATGKGINIGGVAGLAPLAQLKLNSKGEFQKGRIVSFVQNRERGTVLDSGGRAFEVIKNLSLQDFPASSPVFGINGEFSY